MTQSNPLSPEEKGMPLQDETATRQIVLVMQSLIVSTFLFLVLAGYLTITTGAWQSIVFAIVAGVATAFVFVDINLVRRGHIKKASWLLLSMNSIGAVSASLLYVNLGYVAIAYILITNFFIVRYVMFKETRRTGWIITTIALLISVAAELINPIWRQTAQLLLTLSPIITAVLGVAFIVLILYQSWGNILDFMRRSVRNRLTTIIVATSIIPVLLLSGILGVTTFIQARNALTEDTFDRLDAIEEIKTNQLTGYFAERESDMHALNDTMSSLLYETLNKMEALNTLKRNQILQLFETWDADVRDVASDPGVMVGMRNLAIGFQNQGAAQVRSLYSGKPELENAGDETAYTLAHFEQHRFFVNYTSIHGYEDAYLIDLDGNVIYSVYKTDAFGTNLLTGTYKDSSLAKLYKNLVSAQAGTSYIADVAFFEEEYTMFIGAPIYDGSTLVGMLAYQLPLDTIRNIMSERTGQGLTGESFLLAQEDDGRITYRSDRNSLGNEKFVIGYDITDIASPTMHKALDGQTGGGLIAASTGETRINAYKPLDIEGLNWVVFTSVNATEALSPVHTAGEKDFLTTYKEDYGYYDIFLIHPNGQIFYTVAHEPDYGTNILTGPYSDSNLATLVNEIIEEKQFNFIDFAFYDPSGGTPAAFFGTPVLNTEGNIVLIVATQIAKEDINQIMNEAHGLGETGESYIIGQDFLGRMDSRFIDQMGVDTTVLNPDFAVDTEAVRSALAGESGLATIIDYRGLPVLSAWKPFVIHEADPHHPDGQVWAVMTEIDQSEAEQSARQLARLFGAILGTAALVIGGIAVFVGTRFALGFVSPILNLTETATQVAAGDLSQRSEVESVDEIGTLSNTFNTMTAQLQETLVGLEERVAARTQDLATVAEVGTATATILESERLLQEVVNLTKERFNLYHSHIYLLDENGENLVLTAGAGEPGRIMVAEGRSIPLSREQSLVARAARERKGVTVNDVTQAPDYLPNPLLPDTRSELAVPMVVGGNLIGVFDIQSEQVGRFTDSDINIQTTLAAQLATSIQNVRSFERSKKDAELQSLVNLIGSRIQRTTSIEDTLQTAIRELGTAIGASRVRANIRSASEDTPSKPLTPARVVASEGDQQPTDPESTFAE